MELNSNITGHVFSVEEGKVTIKDNNGQLHIYSNLSSEKVEPGQQIQTGDPIGEAGKDLKYYVMGIDFAKDTEL